MSNRFQKGSSVIAAAALVVLEASAALALPQEGDKAPNVRVEDADGRGLEMKNLRGKLILIMYEDKGSAHQNQGLKTELSKLGRGGKYKSTIAVAPVADVSSYDFWPVKGFVKDAIREESKKVGTTIYCDWDGRFRSAYKIREGTSNVILVGKEGRVLFAAEGALKAPERKRLLDLMKTQVEGGS